MPVDTRNDSTIDAQGLLKTMTICFRPTTEAKWSKVSSGADAACTIAGRPSLLMQAPRSNLRRLLPSDGA